MNMRTKNLFTYIFISHLFSVEINKRIQEVTVPGKFH